MIFSFLLMVFFLLCQGFYSGMETGLVSLRQPRVENAAQKGSRSAKMLLFFMNNPGLMISTTLLGVNISVVCASLAAKNFFHQIGLTTPALLLAGTAILSIVMLTCEIIPKNWFREAPFTRCSRFVVFLYATYFLLYLPAHFFNKLTTALSNLIAKKQQTTLGTARMREDLRLYFKESETGGKLHAEAADVLDNSVSFHLLTLKNVMIPLDAMPFVKTTATIQEAILICRDHAVTELPISYSDSPEESFAVFSLSNALFSAEEKEWNTRTVAEFQDHPFRISAQAGILEAIQKARKRGSTLFFIEEKKKIIGFVPLFDLTRRIFSPDN